MLVFQNVICQFQQKMLTHAIQLNPLAVFYSTCSIWREENESVVQQVLEKVSGYALSKKSPLPYSKKALEIFKGTLQGTAQSLPDKHQCRGFYLAKIVRSENEMSAVSENDILEKLLAGEEVTTVETGSINLWMEKAKSLLAKSDAGSGTKKVKKKFKKKKVKS